MKTEKSSSVFTTIIKIGLIVYTLVRTIDLVMSTMPESIKIFGAAAIFGLDIALLAWDNYAADPYKARSKGQHNIAVIMIVVDLIGVGAAMVGDSMRVVSPTVYASAISTIGVWVISIIILSNVGALIGINQLDPDREEAQAAAEHERAIARMENDHDRKMAVADKKTELDVAAYKNREKIKAARKRFYLADEDGNGQPDIVDAAERGDLDALRLQLQSALEALEHTAAKSPNGHSMAADGAPVPKVTDRKG